MEDYERPETVGEAVTPPMPGEGTQAAANTAGNDREAGAERRTRPEEQSHEENRRYQAARLGGERTGYDRAIREVNRRIEGLGMRHPDSGEIIRTVEELETLGRERFASPEERAAALEEFIARDAEAFLREFPGVDVAALDGDEAFRRFCGSRYGRESLTGLYRDYRELSDRAEQTAAARSESRARRATGAGGGSAGDARLTAGQQRDLDEWNRSYPSMKMTAKEFLSR